MLARAKGQELTHGTAYAGYLLLGVGVLAPWNAIITAADYWQATYSHADRLFSICYLPTTLVGPAWKSACRGS